MRKPIIPKLVLFKKKSQKLKKLKRLKHYDYGFLGEYQFSPANSPLIQYRQEKPLRYGGLRNVYSVFFLCRGLRRSLRDGGGVRGDYSMEALPGAAVEDGEQDGSFLKPLDWEDEIGEDDSIDLRAERFIERFYEEIRMQRLESL